MEGKIQRKAFATMFAESFHAGSDGCSADRSIVAADGVFEKACVLILEV